MPKQFENGAKLDGKDFDAIEMYLHPKESISLVPKASKDVLFSSFSSFYTMPFPECDG